MRGLRWAAWAALRVMVCALLGAQMEVAHAEIIEKAGVRFVQHVAHIGISDHGLAVDSPNTIARLSDLFRSSFHLGSDRAKRLVDGDDKAFRQASRGSYKIGVRGLEREGMEPLRQICALCPGRDGQNGGSPAEVIKPECYDCSGLDWRFVIPFEFAAENIGPIRSERLLHFVKLALHNGQLPIEYPVLRPTDADSDGGQDRNSPSSSRGTGRSAVYGILFFLFGASFLKIAFNLLDAADNPIWLSLGGWWIVGLAGLSIVQGTVLALTGNWLP